MDAMNVGGDMTAGMGKVCDCGAHTTCKEGDAKCNGCGWTCPAPEAMDAKM